MDQIKQSGKLYAHDMPADIEAVRALFSQQLRSPGPHLQESYLPELRNPHPEVPVSEAVKSKARKSSVLLPIVLHDRPTLIVTRRHAKIRFGGHICFPGGHLDGDHESHIDAALREAHEEIDLAPQQVEVLGCLGQYYSQAGYEITPVVGLVTPPLMLKANPSEVDGIYELPLADVLKAEAYQLTQYRQDRGHYSFSHSVKSGQHEGEQVRVAGPTVSIMIGFFEALSAFVYGH